MPGAGTTGEVPIYEVLMERIRELKGETKELRDRMDLLVRENTCKDIQADFRKRFDHFRQELVRVERDLAGRVEQVEIVQEEASTMTQTQFEAAVEQGITKANGKFEAAVARGVNRANGKAPPSFWPKTLREVLQSTLFAIALVGMGYTAFDYFASKRVEEQQREQLLQKVQQIVQGQTKP